MFLFIAVLLIFNGRAKLSLVPILGSIGLAYRIVTEEQMRHVKTSIRTLEQNQNSTVHELEHQVSVVNVSRHLIRENREAIRWLSLGFSTVENALENVTHVLSAQIFEADRFIQIYTQIDVMVTQIRQIIDNMYINLMNIREELSFLSLGHISPSIIPPSDLLDLLTGLRKQLPKGFKLPISSTRKLWEYYRFLSKF